MLIPDRIYKENRVNWNANYQQPDNLKHGNANWSLPAWNEPPSRVWNQSNQSNQMKNSRKVSAKQHYLSVARYVAGQSTNLPSRYITFRNPVERILIAYTVLIIGLLVRSHIRQNVFSGYPINLLEIAPLEKNYSLTIQSYDAIICKSIYILTTTMQYLSDTLSRILLPLNIFLSISVLVESICRISWITLCAISKRFLYLCQTLLINCDEYLVKRFIIITDLLDKTCLLALCVINALRYILTIVILIIEFSALCLSRSLNDSRYVLNGTIFYN